jgi:hypothetical protein
VRRTGSLIVVLLLVAVVTTAESPAATATESQAESSLGVSDEHTASGQVSSRTLVENYPAENITWFVAPSVVQSPPLGGENFLRAYQPVGDEIVYQLYVVLKSFENWFWMYRASDASGRRFSIEERCVDKDSESSTEHLLITLSGRYLNSVAAKRGLFLKVTGSRGAIVVELPAFYVKGFLQKVACWTKRTDLGVSPYHWTNDYLMEHSSVSRQLLSVSAVSLLSHFLTYFSSL